MKKKGIICASISKKELTDVRYMKIFSSKNQSNEKFFMQKKITNKNKFKEAIKDIQKKKIRDCT